MLISDRMSGQLALVSLGPRYSMFYYSKGIWKMVKKNAEMDCLENQYFGMAADIFPRLIQTNNKTTNS